MKGSYIAPALLAALVIVLAITVVRTPSASDTSAVELPAQSADSISTPQYLFAHPNLLKEAEHKCQDNGASSALYCSNVHKAESLQLADQYRHGFRPGGATQ